MKAPSKNLVTKDLESGDSSEFRLLLAEVYSQSILNSEFWILTLVYLSS
jgi:hypothetical protein